MLCPDDPSHFSKNVPTTCYLPTCPTCWTKWAARASKSATQTIIGYRRAKKYHYTARHVSLSPPARLLPVTEDLTEILNWMVQEANKLYDDLGVRAAYVVVHPYRLVPQYEAYVSEMAKRAGKNRYRWAFEQPNWRELIYFSPHLHLIFYGYLEDAKTFYERTGWTYRMHRARKEKDLPRTINYLLSHAWVVGNPKIMRYYRGMSQSKLGCTIRRYKVPIYCLTCGARLVRVAIDDNYQDLHNANRASRTLEERTYFIRQKKPPKLRDWLE